MRIRTKLWNDKVKVFVIKQHWNKEKTKCSFFFEKLAHDKQMKIIIWQLILSIRV